MPNTLIYSMPITPHALPPLTSAYMPGATLPCSTGNLGRLIWKYWEAGGRTRRVRTTPVTLRMRTFFVYTLPTSARNDGQGEAGGRRVRRGIGGDQNGGDNPRC